MRDAVTVVRFQQGLHRWGFTAAWKRALVARRYFCFRHAPLQEVTPTRRWAGEIPKSGPFDAAGEAGRMGRLARLEAQGTPVAVEPSRGGPRGATQLPNPAQPAGHRRARGMSFRPLPRAGPSDATRCRARGLAQRGGVGGLPGAEPMFCPACGTCGSRGEGKSAGPTNGCGRRCEFGLGPGGSAGRESPAVPAWWLAAGSPRPIAGPPPRDPAGRPAGRGESAR